jgi:hypothetical protein
MNAHSPISAADPQKVKITAANGHQRRSELLDNFATLESAATAKCKELGLLIGTKASLAQRLATLKKAKFQKADTTSNRLDQCLQLVEIRNDIVHAKLHLVMLPADLGGPTFLFRNVSKPLLFGTAECRMINAAAFDVLQKQVIDCSNFIKQLKAPTLAVPASASE